MVLGHTNISLWSFAAPRRFFSSFALDKLTQSATALAYLSIISAFLLFLKHWEFFNVEESTEIQPRLSLVENNWKSKSAMNILCKHFF